MKWQHRTIHEAISQSAQCRLVIDQNETGYVFWQAFELGDGGQPLTARRYQGNTWGEAMQWAETWAANRAIDLMA